MTDREFRVGVNYWPTRTAMRWWSRFDRAEVAADFATMVAAGLDSVRIFLTWEAFQPQPRLIDTAMVDRLLTVADLAQEAGLALMATMFTGHMSGANFLPRWAIGGEAVAPRFRTVSAGATGRRAPLDWYSDRSVADAQVRLAGALAAALAGHPALWAWDLGNENSNCCIPGSRSAGLDWLGRVVEAIRVADGGAAVTIGLHMEDLEEDRRIGPAEAATVCDFLTMHGYPIYAPWAAGPTDDHLLAFLTHMTRWLGGGIDVAFTEFGLPTLPPGLGHSTEPMLVEETVAAAYLDRALRNVRDAGASAALVWCYGDYAETIWHEPPLDLAVHERSFGLWRADGTPKPAVTVLSRCSAQTRAPISAAQPAPLPDLAWIDLEPAEFFTAGGSHLARLYGRYRAALGLDPGLGVSR